MSEDHVRTHHLGMGPVLAVEVRYPRASGC